MALYIHLGCVLDGHKDSNALIDYMIHNSNISFMYRLDLLNTIFDM